MTPEEFKHYWENHYNDCPPVGYYLRESYKGRWFRFHTLPGGKRYAETDDEYQTILLHHNTVLSDLLKGLTYILVTTGHSDTPTPVFSYAELNNYIDNRKHWLSIPMHEFEKDDSPNYWHFFMSERVWSPKSCDEIFRLVADNVVSGVLFVGISERCIYHPYDGGADVILSSQHLKNIYRDKYSAWVSKHPLGL